MLTLKTSKLVENSPKIGLATARRRTVLYFLCLECNSNCPAHSDLPY